jgi:SAM-dependent methyltransferase
MDDPLRDVNTYFSTKVTEHGATFKGVDYGNAERQALCFDQLMKLHRDPAQPLSLVDYGCGYGALIPYLHERQYQVTAYSGFDISHEMIAQAAALYGQQPNTRFTADKRELAPADYVIAGGIFNVRMSADDATWQQVILTTLHELWALARRGMAFNILTKYSDADKMRDYLYYADPCFLFDYCKTHFAKDVALLHDYGVYEFTMLVRRPPAG